MKRPDGHGSITLLPSGRYRARVRFGGKRVDLGTYPTYEEAEGMIAAALKKASERQIGPRPSLSSWAPLWLDELELSGYVAMPTARSIVRNHLAEAPFWSWPLAEVTPRAIRRWLESLARRGDMGPSYVRQVLGRVRACFEHAVEEGLVDTNPARDVRAPRMLAETEEPWTWLDAQEQAALLTCDEVPHAWRIVLAFAIGTGLRQGELFNLQRADVTLDRDRPEIVVRYGSRGRAPKGRRIRRVPLFGVGLAAAREWLEVAPTWCPVWESQALMFPGPRGGRQKVSRIPELPAWLKAAGIDRRVRPHDLRHTCGASLVSGLWGEPWRLEEVRDFLGHRSVKQTERYAHLAPDALHAKARRGARLGPGDPAVDVSSVISAISGVSEGNPAQKPRSRGDSCSSDLGLAHELLELVAAGQDPGDLPERLAQLVLAEPAAALARRVLEGGPHAVDRALDLAELLLARPARNRRSG